jgi:hypothetical protein
MPVGCANSDRACELAVRIRRGAVVWRPTDRLGGPLRAVEVRLPHPVPLHPAIGAAGPRRCRQGPGDPGAPSPAGRAAPPNQTTQARSCRPSGACRHQPRLVPSPLVVLLRQARDAAALAPAAGRRRLDLPAPRNRSTSTRPGAAAAHRPPGPGEPTLGLPTHPGRAAPAWDTRLGHRDPHHAAPPPTGSDAATDDHHLASVHASAGCWDRRLRLLHRRHRLAAAALHLVLHRTRHSPGPPGPG